MNPSTNRGRFWPGMIFGMIGLNFCIVGITVYAARFHSSSFAIEADYDTKALHWDNTARQIRENVELGWKVEITEAQGNRLVVSLKDRDGKPIEGAAINVESFHHAHAKSKAVSTMMAGESGQYSTPANLSTLGLWEFRFTVLRGPTLFTQSMTRMVTAPEGTR